MPGLGDASGQSKSAPDGFDLDAPVGEAAFFGHVRGYRPEVTVPPCNQAFARDTAGEHEIDDRWRESSMLASAVPELSVCPPTSSRVMPGNALMTAAACARTGFASIGISALAEAKLTTGRLSAFSATSSGVLASMEASAAMALAFADPVAPAASNG